MQCASSIAMNRTPHWLQHAPEALAAFADEAFGRHVQQPAAILAQARDHLVALADGLGAVQERRRDAVDAQAVDLVFHQRDERRHDERDTLARGRGRAGVRRMTSAGAWKQSDFPPPVGRTTTLSRPSRTACMASRCSGRKSEKPQMRCSASRRASSYVLIRISSRSGWSRSRRPAPGTPRPVRRRCHAASCRADRR